MASRRRILAELDRLEPRIARAFREAVGRIQSRARLSELEDAIRANDIQRAARAAGLGGSVWALVTESMRGVYIEGGTFQADEAPARLGFDFDVNAPRAEAWLRNHSSEFVTLINNEQREAIREAVTAGAAAGQNPNTTAKDIVGRIDRKSGRRAGGIVGLTEQQAGAVTKARAALRSGDPQEMRYYLTLTKRDRRFDGRVQKAIDGIESLTEADINRITGRLSDRYLDLRGKNVARTETLGAFQRGQFDSIQQAIDEGLVRDVQKRWDSAADGRTRPDHSAADAASRDGIPMDQPFVVGGRQMMHPGDPAGGAAQIINCRCVLRTEVNWLEQ